MGKTKLKLALGCLLAGTTLQAATLKTKVTVLNSLDTQQSYSWFAPGYASTDCSAEATAQGTSSYASAQGAANCQSYSRPPASGTTTIQGHVLYLQMPDLRVIVASCDKRVNWTDWGGGIYRDCRAPQCTTCDAEISGEKVKISWPVSLDGTKRKAETYKIQTVLEPKPKD